MKNHSTKNKIAVVTGANGFIGKHLVNYLLQNNFIVRCIDINCTAYQTGASYFECDLSIFEELTKTKALENADYIFHLAGVTKRTRLNEFVEGNYTTTLNLLKALKTTKNNLKRFIYLSSQAAAGPAKSVCMPVKETDSPFPVEAYGRSKLDAEILLRRQTDIPYTIIRPSCVYGPGDVDFFNIFKQVQKHFAIYADNKKKFASIIYVEDLVDGIIKAALAETTERKIYFLTEEKLYSWRDIYHSIKKLLNKKVIEIIIPYRILTFAAHFGNLYSRITGKYPLLNTHKIKLAEAEYWLCSCEAAKRDFGFMTNYSLDQGLVRTLQYINNDK